MLPLNVSRLSLSLRISLVVASLLMLAGAITGYAIFQRVERSLKQDLDSRINERMAWIEASIELDHGRLEFEPNQAHLESNVAWQVTLRDGRVLWSDHWTNHSHKTTTRTALIVVGNPGGELLTTDSITKIGPGGQFGDAYQLPAGNGKIDLRLTTRTPIGNIGEELHRLSLALWTIGPLSILTLSIIFALFIRRQLRPLGEIAALAARIGPQNFDKRIKNVGSSVECVLLQNSINSMIERLADGLSRERQFAYAAAHELRTPVAQLRTSIEVTLRKERGLEEYQSTLTQSLEDVVRMQRLIEQLLQLTKYQQSVETLEPVSLNNVLAKAQRAANVAVNNVNVANDALIKGNEELLICGFRNVLENAARYAPGALPVIETSVNEGVVQTVIADQGPGIPEPDRERVFDPLMRLDQARSIGDSAGGFGLGLTVARSAIRACGGDLFCRARADGKSGTEFVYRFKQS